MTDLAEGLLFYVVFLFSTTLHEAAHAWAAKLGGDLTAYHGGQVSLSPLPHIRREPVGMVMLPLISVVLSGWPFGFASAPYDPLWALRNPRRAAWMAAAGPGANLLLSLAAGLAIALGATTGYFNPPDQVVFSAVTAASQPGLGDALAFLASAFFSLNLLLAVLNMFPLPPLDGSSVSSLFMQHRTAVRYQEFLMRNRGLAIVGIIIAWQVFDRVFQPVWLAAVNLLYQGVTYG